MNSSSQIIELVLRGVEIDSISQLRAFKYGIEVPQTMVVK